jgi:hypothetical protein
MSERREPAGWVVQLTIPKALEEPSSLRSASPAPPSSSFLFFNVAVATPDKAVVAALNAAKVPGAAIARVVRSLSAAEIAALRLREGEVKPA